MGFVDFTDYTLIDTFLLVNIAQSFGQTTANLDLCVHTIETSECADYYIRGLYVLHRIEVPPFVYEMI